MVNDRRIQNRVKVLRLGRGWSQAELAQRAGISRAAVSAIEVRRLVPSVAAALSLAAAFSCSVEELFSPCGDTRGESEWAWSPHQVPCRYWHARVGNRTLLYPVEANPLGVSEHDGVFSDGTCQVRSRVTPEETLVMACCDPAAGLLAKEYARFRGFRLLVLPRSSHEALSLLGQGLVHVAGVHLCAASCDEGNDNAVKTQLCGDFDLLRVARWQDGLALSRGQGIRSVQSVLRSRLTWVGREPGSGARQCLDELLRGRHPPRRVARDHRGVAEAVRCGWADVGVCLQLVSEEVGLRFLSVREENYDLCYSAYARSDPRIQALVNVLRSSYYRRSLGDLPGYDPSECGEVQPVC